MPLLGKGARKVRLGYAANAHPAYTLEAVHDSLRAFAGAVRRRFSPDAPMGIELHLGRGALDVLNGRGPHLSRLKEAVREEGLTVFSLNGYPLCDFQAAAVKEAVFRPSFLDPERVRYTCLQCEILSAFVEPGEIGTVSTLAGAFRPDGDGPQDRRRIAAHLAEVVADLHARYQRSGRKVILCLEPEPWTTMETAADVVLFWREALLGAGLERLAGLIGHSANTAEGILRDFLAVNLDAGHHAVAFEEPCAAARLLLDEGIPIGKVHLSACPVLPRARSNWGLLAALAEPRFLHQVSAGTPGKGRVFRAPDLPAPGAPPPPEADDACEARVHFHIPLDAEPAPPFRTTAAGAADLIALLVPHGVPHFVVETYTWDLFRAGGAAAVGKGTDVVEGIAREMAWAKERIERFL